MAPNDVYAQNRIFDKGPACFNATPEFPHDPLLYHVPGIKSENAIARGVLNGWWTGALVSWETGEPFSVVETISRSLSSNLGPSGGDHVNLGTATVALARWGRTEP